MIPVKICGITSLKNASMAVNFGASALGLIFYRGSLRYVEPYKTEKWISQISGQVKKVGVFVIEENEAFIFDGTYTPSGSPSHTSVVLLPIESKF